MAEGQKHEDLKPCPFCGAPAQLEEDADHHGEWFNLGCSRHWDAKGVKDGEQCPGGRIWYTEDPEGMGKAISAWNTRAESGLVKELAEALGMLWGQAMDANGVMAEYVAMPCDSLRAKFPTTIKRLSVKLDRAREVLAKHQATGQHAEQLVQERDEALFDYAALSKDDLIAECKRLWNLNGQFLRDLTHERSEVSRLCDKLLEQGKELTAALMKRQAAKATGQHDDGWQPMERESNGLQVGEFNLFRRGEKIAIHHESGEGGDFSELELAKAIKGFYGENF